MKNIRSITIEGKEYYWSLKGDEIYTEARRIIIGLKGTSYSRIYVDPYAHDFQIGPKSVANAVAFARGTGWRPEDNSGDVHLNSNDGASFERISI